MALAIFGSPTKISCASSGRSMIIERPTPSCRLLISPRPIDIEEAGPESLAWAGAATQSAVAIAKAVSPLAQTVLSIARAFLKLRFMGASSARRLLRRAVAHDGQSFGLRFRGVVDGDGFAGAVDQAAQHQ